MSNNSYKPRRVCLCGFDGEMPTNWVSLQIQKSLKIIIKKILQLSPGCDLNKDAL